MVYAVFEVFFTLDFNLARDMKKGGIGENGVEAIFISSI